MTGPMPDQARQAVLHVLAVHGLPEIANGDRLSLVIHQQVPELSDGDVVVVASKVVAKAEGRVVACDRDDHEAREQLIEQEAARVLRRRDDLLITETRHGFICANAGIDWSSIAPGHAVLLPEDPDRSARRIRDGLRGIADADVGVIVSDTFGRAWREGTVDVAIGSAGIKPVIDLHGHDDGYGNELQSTRLCVVDQLAATANTVMTKPARVPVVVIRGVDPDWFGVGSVAADVVRHPNRDLFR